MFKPCASELLSYGLKSWVKVTPVVASSYSAGPALLVVLVLDEDDVDDVLPHAATPRATPAATIAIFPSFI
jgi:hypothetical protein